MWVGALSVGPRGKKLNSTFNNRENAEYKVSDGSHYPLVISS